MAGRNLPGCWTPFICVKHRGLSLPALIIIYKLTVRFNLLKLSISRYLSLTNITYNNYLIVLLIGHVSWYSLLYWSGSNIRRFCASVNPRFEVGIPDFMDSFRPFKSSRQPAIHRHLKSVSLPATFCRILKLFFFKQRKTLKLFFKRLRFVQICNKKLIINYYY